MADSTQSDADKIRAKRLAKLGGPATSTPSTPAANGAGSPSTPTTPPQSAASPAPQQPAQPTAKSPNGTALSLNPFEQLGIKAASKPTNQITITPRSTSQKRESDGSVRPRSRQGEKPVENMGAWEDKSLGQIFRITLKPEVLKDIHGHSLTLVASTRGDLVDQGAPLMLNVGVLEGAITEAATHATGGKPFEYLLACFKRVSRVIRSLKTSGPDDPKLEVLKETRRLCMSYAVFAVTMPEMFGENVPLESPLVQHLLVEPDTDTGICHDFLTEAVSRFEEDETIREALVGGAEQLSIQLSNKTMLDNYQPYVRGLRNLMRFPKIMDAITQSPLFLPEGGVATQDVETKTLLGPFFALSPMQPLVAQDYFSSPKTRDRGFIQNSQNAVRMALTAHQAELYMLTDTIVKAGAGPRTRMLDWFALTVNANHKKRAMRVDYKTVSSDAFMVNVTTCLDQLCEPFMDAKFGKIDRIDVDYLRRSPRVDISDETKINADQKTADAFYANKADGTSNFISEVFFLTVAAHHYGTEAANTRLATSKKSIKRTEKDLEAYETERHQYINDPRYLARFEEHINMIKKNIDDAWSMIHATEGVLLDDLNQARSMQFMRYVIVWLLRLASRQNYPAEELRLPLPPNDLPEVFRCLPEYFMEDIVDNFKFITSNIPHIVTTTQAEEIITFCITFLRSTEFVKNPGVKSGLVSILYYGAMPYYNRSKGILGDLLNGSTFAHKHLLHALMRYYIECESSGTHTQFYDKFSIRYEIFQVVKCIWANTLYRENLAAEARINTDFFVQFVNMLVNDVTYVLDESFSSFHKIHDLTKELRDTPASAMDAEQRKEKEELLAETKGRAKSYMDLTKSTMEMLVLFTETLADAFTMPEIVTRLADMLDYNLESMVGEKRRSLRVENPQEYGFQPKQLLGDIVSVFQNLAGKDNFIAAIARDGRSYKPSNFPAATAILQSSALKSPGEIAAWTRLGERVAAAKTADEAEEEDLGDIPDEFLDPLMADMMKDPVILPSSKQTVDRSTIRSHLLSDPTDPFNRVPLKIEDVTPDLEMKSKIDAFIAEAKARKQGDAMDTTLG